MRNRSLVLKCAVLILLVSIELVQPSSLAAQGSSFCGICGSTCPSIWDLDTLCHFFCAGETLGWCPVANDLCSPWDVFTLCQGFVQ